MTILSFRSSSIVHKTTPSSTRLPRYSQMGELCWRTQRKVLQGLITDEYEEQHLAGIAILIVPGIGRNLFSVNTAARKGIVSIFNVNNPRLEATDIAVQLRREDDDLYSFKLDLNSDGYAGKELATYCSGQVWHQRLCHLNKRSLLPLQNSPGSFAPGGATPPRSKYFPAPAPAPAPNRRLYRRHRK